MTSESMRLTIAVRILNRNDALCPGEVQQLELDLSTLSAMERVRRL